MYTATDKRRITRKRWVLCIVVVMAWFWWLAMIGFEPRMEARMNMLYSILMILAMFWRLFEVYLTPDWIPLLVDACCFAFSVLSFLLTTVGMYMSVDLRHDIFYVIIFPVFAVLPFWVKFIYMYGEYFRYPFERVLPESILEVCRPTA
jgi:hypothetical protein